jgi:hypothetical protein
VRDSASQQNLPQLTDQSITMPKCFLYYAHVFAVQSGYIAAAKPAPTQLPW